MPRQTLEFATFGVRFRVVIQTQQPVDVSTIVPPCSAYQVPEYSVQKLELRENSASSEDRGSGYVFVDGMGRAQNEPTLPDGLHLLRQEIHLTLALESPDLTFLHAGVVEWNGRTILLPGQSLSGKSTLVLDLVRSGAKYLSDEFAVIDRQGVVHPFPLSIKIRRASQPALHLTVPPQQRVSEPRLADLIVFTKFRPSARWSPEPITAGPALLHLLENTVAVRRWPLQTMKTLKQVVSLGRAYSSLRPDTSCVKDWLRTLA
jgi:hypothetical protein